MHFSITISLECTQVLMYGMSLCHWMQIFTININSCRDKNYEMMTFYYFFTRHKYWGENLNGISPKNGKFKGITVEPAWSVMRSIFGMKFRVLFTAIFTQREGTMGCLLHKSQKFYNNVFVFVSFTSLVTLVDSNWLIH